MYLNEIELAVNSLRSDKPQPELDKIKYSVDMLRHEITELKILVQNQQQLILSLTSDLESAELVIDDFE